MSMYRELVDLAVRVLEASHAGLEGAELEAALVQEVEVRRRDLERERLGQEASTAIAAQVGYDALLVSLCRILRIPYDASWFEVPDAARLRLEASLRERGILLGSPPASAASSR